MLLTSVRKKRDELFDQLLEKGYKESELLKCCQSGYRLMVTNYASIQSQFNKACDDVLYAEHDEYKRAMQMVPA